jgi:exonuclease VII small subunit
VQYLVSFHTCCRIVGPLHRHDAKEAHATFERNRSCYVKGRIHNAEKSVELVRAWADEMRPADWRNILDLNTIIKALESERDQLDRAIAALKGQSKVRRARRLSVAARRRISAAQKKRWARARSKA